MTGRSSAFRIAAVGLALVIVLLASQALAFSNVSGTADATKALGQAGFAYLGGLRVYAAAVLWNRLEPQFHQYYDGLGLGELKFLLPTVRLVQLLDPQFEQAYYNAAYIVQEAGDEKQALEIAREGVANNPNSALMAANLVQILYIQDEEGNKAEYYAEAKRGVSRDMKFANTEDAYEAFAIFRTAFRLAGDEPRAQAVNKVLEKLKESGAGDAEAHDHDGDGEADH